MSKPRIIKWLFVLVPILYTVATLDGCQSHKFSCGKIRFVAPDENFDLANPTLVITKVHDGG